MDKYVKKISKVCVYVLSIGLMLYQTIPYIITTLYTFPLQDDYVNTMVVLKDIGERGGNAFFAALRLAVEGYTGYRGYYFSLFLTYFTDGIVQCNVDAIRIWQCIQLILFYSLLIVLIFLVAKAVFGCDKYVSIVAAFTVITCFCSLFYFSNNETLFWFCASTIYELPAIVLFAYLILFGVAIVYRKKLLLPVLFVLGFLSGGASVNVAALGCVLAVMCLYWGLVVKHEKVMSIVGVLPMIIGSLMNVLAPGNYRKAVNEPMMDRLYKVLMGSSKYAINRFILFFKETPLLIVLIILLFGMVLLGEKKEEDYKYPVPLLFSILSFVGVIATIMPVQWASGVEAYEVYERCIIISDLAMDMLLCINVLYWGNWIRCRILKNRNLKLDGNIVGVCILVASCFVIFSSYDIASTRLAAELRIGRPQEYGQWAAGIVRYVAASNEDVVVINTKVVKDKTCMAAAFYYVGEYDPETEYTGNSSMAQFFNKKAVYIIEEEQTE